MLPVLFTKTGAPVSSRPKCVIRTDTAASSPGAPRFELVESAWGVESAWSGRTWARVEAYLVFVGPAYVQVVIDVQPLEEAKVLECMLHMRFEGEAYDIRVVGAE